jgi:hypothetical protein
VLPQLSANYPRVGLLTRGTAAVDGDAKISVTSHDRA